jgi:hypothetical protein
VDHVAAEDVREGRVHAEKLCPASGVSTSRLSPRPRRGVDQDGLRDKDVFRGL